MSRPPNVFTIPVGIAQLPTFAAAFLSGQLFGRGPLSPLEIAESCIFVPTRRASSALASELVRAAGSSAMLLPSILPLGDPDALDDVFALPGAIEARPAIGDLDRRLALFRLIDAWRGEIARMRKAQGDAESFHVGQSRADAFALSGDLARLIEETIIEGVPLERLANGLPEAYRPERHSQYWDMTGTFLRIAAAYYPQMLEEQRKTDPAAQVMGRLAAFAHRIAEQQTSAPMVVLGSTGSVSATSALMAAIARLPQGAVVLPGLDLLAGEADHWSLIGAEDGDLSARFAHPQAILKRTLQRIGIARSDVMSLLIGQEVNPRARLASEIFRPAAATDGWQTSQLTAEAREDALSGITLVEAADEREEALAIALMFRQVLETPGRSAALVTPDRQLARMVQAELKRWGVSVADSAGEPLAGTPTASLARLALKAVAPNAGAIDILALLRHPRATLGLAEETRAIAVDAIDIAALRGKRLAGGLAALPHVVEIAIAEKLDRASAVRKRIGASALIGGLAHARRMAEAADRFSAAIATARTLRAWAAAHRALIEVLHSPGMEIPGVLGDEDGLALAAVFDAIANAADDGPDLSHGDYAAMFDELLADKVVRPRQPGHPRLKIWGLLEARLLDADRIILAGLDEGIWPPEARGDPFLNRPMRIALGLQPPERRIGQTAHDFMMLLGASDLVMTRAKKRGGSPATASRFLRRLGAFVGDAAFKQMATDGEEVLRWARALDAPSGKPAPVSQPSPRPPAALTPERLSLTEIETLYRDPYTVFARRILGLDPLPEVDPPLDARDRGNIVHEALSRFTKQHDGVLPSDAEAALISFGKAAFAAVQQEMPETVQFWLRRFEAFVPWFIDWDRKRRDKGGALHSEIDGSHVLTLPGERMLTIRTRADRIEQHDDGGFSVVDYKTGQPPSNLEVLRGLAPQLPLTAALIQRGGFPKLGSVALDVDFNLAYLHVAKAGGAGKEVGIKPKARGSSNDKQEKDGSASDTLRKGSAKQAKAPDAASAAEAAIPDAPTMQEVIESQFDELQHYLARLVNNEIGYTAHRMPKSVRYRSDYDHLARVAEWSLGGDDDGSEAS